MATADTVATDVLAGDGGLGAAKFEGWLAGPASTTGSFRFYTHPQFQEWLEIAVTDVLSQVKSAAGRPAGGSTIWVKREARITRCQSGRAEYFEDLAAGASSDDPAATRYPPR